jgi:pSer/pThr/pTyr-binding forkhead associated (FHA) protein
MNLSLKEGKIAIMPLQIDSFLLILRLLLIVLLYLFLMQVVLAITRDLGKAAVPKGPAVLGHLVVIDRRGQCTIPLGTSYPLGAKATIGRGPANTIQIQDNTISAQHVHLSYHNGKWYIQDAGSSNGTYVNNQPVREAIPAGEGDTLGIGDILFQIRK